MGAYEDTGLSPEDVEKLKTPVLTITASDESRFREIMQEERGGRLEVLPHDGVNLRQIIEESRALTVAINSLRFIPDLCEIEVQNYELILANMRNRMQDAEDQRCEKQ